jgi:hypothetical protein
MSSVSWRLRDHENQLETEIKIPQQENDVEQTNHQVQESQENEGNNQIKQEVEVMETMQIEGGGLETIELPRQVRERENSSLQQDNDEMLLYQGQMFKESQK